MKKVKMKDIGDRLNISTVTVSKALNNRDGVSDELKLKIQTLAFEMGYVIPSKQMSEETTLSVGVIVSERFVSDDKNAIQSFYSRFFQAVASKLAALDCYCLYHRVSYADEENLELPNLVTDGKINGLIVLGQFQTAFLQKIVDTGIPLVFLDFYDENFDVDAVLTDNYFSSYNLTNYLIRKGHSKIAFVGDIHATQSIQDRFLGYYKALIERRIVLPPDYIISDRDAKGKLFESFTLPEDKPTAFVCTADLTAYVLINDLRANGYRIPDDFSVVGFDNDIYSQILSPQLTTVAVNMSRMAKRAAELLVTKIRHGRKTIGKILIKTKMIEADSVKDLNVH